LMVHYFSKKVSGEKPLCASCETYKCEDILIFVGASSVEVPGKSWGIPKENYTGLFCELCAIKKNMA